MNKISISDDFLHFWIKDFIPGAFNVESELFEDYILTESDFEYWLLQTNKIGCFYSDDGQGDVIVTLEDIKESEDETELNQLINSYMIENVLPNSGIEYEKLLQAHKYESMWDFAPMPESDTYSEVEAQQRTPAPQLEERELKLF